MTLGTGDWDFADLDFAARAFGAWTFAGWTFSISGGWLRFATLSRLCRSISVMSAMLTYLKLIDSRGKSFYQENETVRQWLWLMFKPFWLIHRVK